MLRLRASAVLVKNESILLIRRENARGLYYVFPGGGIESGENAEQAVIREMREEAGIDVVTEGVMYHTINDFDDNTLVICRCLTDTEPVWQEVAKQIPGDSFAFEWVTLSGLPKYNLLPLEGRDAVILHAKN